MTPRLAPLIALLVAAGPARADDAYLPRVAAAVQQRIDAIVEARAPKLVPPVPIKVAWRPVKLGSLDLGAPLVALTAADLDGDGKPELYAVTGEGVVRIGVRGHRASELGRVAFAGPRAVPAPRDVVGTAFAGGGELVAATSGWVNELRVAWQGKQLVAQPGGPGFLVCAQERVPLVAGRNYFGTPPSDLFYGVRCRDDLVDPSGYPLRIRAQLARNGKLTVAIQKCSARVCPAERAPDRVIEFAGVGAAFDVADVDRDGEPEVIVSGDAAPGDPDFVKVMSVAAPGKPLFKRSFQSGVAAIATIDSDADGAIEVIAAVRLAGATRVDLWRLD